MRQAIKRILPEQVRWEIRQMIKSVRYTYRYWLIRVVARFQSPLRIIVGAAETSQPGWYSTNEQWLDITQEADWRRIFGERQQLSHVVAEHVFEHLTQEESLAALKYIHARMIPGGRVRIAVPDGNHPNPEYLRHVGIDGIGADAADHKQLLTVKTLSDFFENTGFFPQHVEGYTRAGNLVETKYSVEDGFILRSRANKSPKITAPGWDFPDSRTSLIVDGIKES